MNTMLATTASLPRILKQPISAGRRCRIDNYRLNPDQVNDFNRLLARLGRKELPLDSDQLATAARQLRTSEPATAPCIVERMRRFDALRSMVADSAWTPANGTTALAMVVIGYVNGHEHVIPEQLPGAVHLDDAIVVDTAWPRLSSEVDEYLDFHRLHLVEASLHGCDPEAFTFTRDAWQQARLAEAALAKHQRGVRERSYIPTTSALFQVR
ncbi:MAG: hypothetical protein M3Q42_03700 [Pseudomonadota bacterium]|nr:hypothetical protein [Pseudomonadota bacterium]